MQSATTGQMDTVGHEFQRELADALRSSLRRSQRDEVEIRVSPPGSILPDITITHRSHPDSPLHIECKAGRSQGGAITWVHDGSDWSVSPRAAKGRVVCEADPAFCAALTETLRGPAVMNRVERFRSKHVALIPEFSSLREQIPFTTCKEAWNLVRRQVSAELKAESTDDSEILWSFPIRQEHYWSNLARSMQDSHLLCIQGQGTFRIGGLPYPEPWFLPSATLLQAPLLDEITAEPQGGIEARFKASGKPGEVLVQRNRRMFVCGEHPRAGSWIHVEDLKGAREFDPVRGTMPVSRHPYTVRPQYEDGCIGQVQSIHRSYRASVEGRQGHEVICDIVHETRIVTFETNLRIVEVRADTPVDIERLPRILTDCIY